MKILWNIPTEDLPEIDTKKKVVNEFKKWANTDLLNSIKKKCYKETIMQNIFALNLLPDEEEYKEIEKMSDEELFDKLNQTIIWKQMKLMIFGTTDYIFK